jgi:hypothetical protein
MKLIFAVLALAASAIANPVLTPRQNATAIQQAEIEQLTATIKNLTASISESQ